MEPITLCGIVIVAFGCWIEFEATLKALAKIVGSSRMLAGITSLFSDQAPGYTNKHVPYTR